MKVYFMCCKALASVRINLTQTCVSPPLGPLALVASVAPALSAPWSGQTSRFLSFPYWVNCGPGFLSSGGRRRRKRTSNRVLECWHVKGRPPVLWCHLGKKNLLFTHSFLAFSFEADDWLSFGFVHNYRPLILPCRTKTIDSQENGKILRSQVPFFNFNSIQAGNDSKLLTFAILSVSLGLLIFLFSSTENMSSCSASAHRNTLNNSSVNGLLPPT